MTSQEEASWTLREFSHDVEERCLRAYDHLVIQNASDIARESDRLRNHANREKKHQKKRQGEAIKRPEEEASGAADGTHRGKHLRMGLADLPPAPGQSLGVRSQSLDSVGGADDDDDADERKRPPPKPRRDPGTKLSGSSEALHAQDEVHSHPCGEDWRRTPPPKPKRNPDTQLSSSFDEAGAAKETSPGRGRSPAPRDEPESVYIEMAANVAAEGRADPDESVYEEMKYSDWRPSPRHIPQPFPNLLTHRPPLLVFPPFPPTRSPNSDESPLTPVDVTRLSMAGKKAKRGADEEERPPARDVAPSGRSSAPPLPCGPRAELDDASPRSQSACPSPVSAARSRTPLSLKGPPPYEALMAGRPPGARGAKRGGRPPPTSARRPAAAEWSGGRGAEEFKRLHPLGRSSSASGAPFTPRDHPALSQMPWLCRDVTMMETIEKKRVLCGEIKSHRRAALPAGARKQPPPYPAAVLWDTAI